MNYEEMDKPALLLELYRLKRKLDDYEKRYGAIDEEEDTPYLSLSMTAEEKLKIFMDYFAGRPDVIAERYISKSDGKKRYSLGCLNKFQPGCDIQKTHCKNCPLFVARPYDEEAVRAHMKREDKMIGIYPIHQGNYVRFFVFDLDKDSYADDAIRLRETLHSLAVYPVLEMSQSGKGIHVWVFFEDKVKASDARKIANYVLTLTMDRYGGFSLDSYDRVIPSQDKLEPGGYGNCIGLPLNKPLSEEGKTVFLKHNLDPIAKPIEYLSTVPKMSKAKVKELLDFAEKKDEYGLFGQKAIQSFPISKDDFATPVHLHVNGDIYIPLVDLKERSKRFLIRISSVPNKEYFKRVNAHISTYNVPRFMTCSKMDERHFRLPRGYKDPLVAFFRSHSIPYELTSSLSKGNYLSASLKVELRDKQVRLLEKALTVDSGILVAPTGFGKSVLGAALITRRCVNTLILVPSMTLQKQWLERLPNYLDVACEGKKGPFGSLSGAGDKRNGYIDVATIQSLVRNEGFRKDAKSYGMILVDEAHHVAANQFESALRELAPKYLYGLTATPRRSDEREDFLFQTFGEAISLEEEESMPGFLKKYHPRFTKFSSAFDGKDIASLLTDLTRDEERNRLICEDTIKIYKEKGKILLLTERIEHARILYGRLKKDIDNLIILYGGQDKKERTDHKERLDHLGNEPFVVVSIGKYIGEGFDDPRFNALFITYPFKWKGMLEQYCGRLQRKHEAIKAIDVYDYVDALVPALSRMYRAREKGYFDLGYSLVGLNPSYQSEILARENYEKRLNEDIVKTKESALFFLSFAHEERLKHLVGLCSCPRSIFVTGGTEVGDIEGIQRLDKALPNMIILDARIVYYGGINPFAYSKEEGTIMRLEDPSIAKDLCDALLKEI